MKRDPVENGTDKNDSLCGAIREGFNLSCKACASEEIEAYEEQRNYESCGWHNIWLKCSKCQNTVQIVDESW